MAVPRGPSGDRPNPGRRLLLTCPREGRHDQLPSRLVTTPSWPSHGLSFRPDTRSPGRPRPLSCRRPARCARGSSHPVRRPRSRGRPTRGPSGPTHAAGSGHARRCGRTPLDAINSPHATAPHLAGWSSLPSSRDRACSPKHPALCLARPVRMSPGRLSPHRATTMSDRRRGPRCLAGRARAAALTA